ncbi:hypothetical protein ACFYO5_35430 [Streptomyces sp. NPDC006259]|uniref:hypothetical protein n=1 Tax=Streptomyces sp. NPDC006259 TaxID=3364740 RepID=UPI0036BE09CC
MTRRAGLFGELEKTVRKYAFEDEEDALSVALAREESIAEARVLSHPDTGTGMSEQPERPSGTDANARPEGEAEKLAADLRAGGLVPVDHRTDEP